MNNDKLSLSELNAQISHAVRTHMQGRFHVVAEISQLQENYNGHAYLELIEKDPVSDNLQAKARATIWASVYRMIKPYFKSVTGSKLEAGMKVLLVVTVEFHELYGFSLNVKDIDPTFTLGDMERKRLEILNQLENEGVTDINKSLKLPEVPQRIAVISSKTAAGYGDFMNQLNSNEYGYVFYTQLFQASMQGKTAGESIVKALDTVALNETDFDAVIIIRGGGSKTDLEAFNDYWLALNIAQFPLPVITGIGHERDESIADIVAHTSLKTPTAVAEFFINKLSDFDYYLDELKDEFTKLTEQILNTKKTDIERITLNFIPLVNEKIQGEHYRLTNFKERLPKLVEYHINTQKNKLENLPKNLKSITKLSIQAEKQVLNNFSNQLKNKSTRRLISENHKFDLFRQKANLLKPERILKRGFAYIRQSGKIIKDSALISDNQEFEIVMRDGKLKSVIKK